MDQMVSTDRSGFPTHVPCPQLTDGSLVPFVYDNDLRKPAPGGSQCWIGDWDVN
jgi:hypothetical protein